MSRDSVLGQNVLLSLTFRERGNSGLGYRMDNGGFQVLFQNGCGVNLTSHALGTVESFPKFKAEEAREQTTSHSAEVYNECYLTATVEGELQVIKEDFLKNFCSIGGNVNCILVLKCKNLKKATFGIVLFISSDQSYLNNIVSLLIKISISCENDI